MFARFRSRLTYANVVATLALLFAVGTGGAYAANTIGSSDVIDESLLADDIKNGEVKTAEIKDGTIKDNDMADSSIGTVSLKDGGVAAADVADGAVNGAKLADGAVGSSKLQDAAVNSATVLDDSLGAGDLATNAVGQPEITTDGVAATEIQDDSIDAGEIVDFGLTNQDVGVLFAEVTSTGTLSNSSGSVTTTKIGGAGTGQYEVDFGRNVNLCTAVATIGGATTGTALGEVNVADRAGNTEAVFVDTNNSDGTAADKAFRLVVVC